MQIIQLINKAKKLDEQILAKYNSGLSSLIQVFLAFIFVMLIQILAAIFPPGFMLLFLIPLVLAYVFYNRHCRFIESFFGKLAKELEFFDKELDNIDQIEIIQGKLNSILCMIQNLLKFRDTTWLFTGEYLEKEIYIFTKDITSYIYLLLTDLRSDLSIRLTKQQKVLESAKSKIDSNIRGTSELVNVSELQKVRLDRQIEQFEELQRVLVKV